MTLEDFDFDLPEQLIALRPERPRPASRLLVAGPDWIADRHVSDLPSVLRSGDLLVFNDTKVLPARLRGTRRRATVHGSGVASVEVTLAAALPDGLWHALARPAKRLADGDRIVFDDQLSAQVLGRTGGMVTLRFDQTAEGLDAALSRLGEIPLPPYIAGRRPADAQDRTDYQTVFARVPGAVAAPTASLHFDSDLLDQLRSMGVQSCFVTLHVGAGTFLPVSSDSIDGHKMHAEWGRMDATSVAAIIAAKARGARVIPVGTTALRLIETAAASGTLKPYVGMTDIFLRPGSRFHVADGLMTNFHLPRSTLLMLVSALMGTGRIQAIYAHAIAHKYRFFSYGDSSLLLPARVGVENDLR
ncbi:MAG: tRNA preQ1(34) S-adenosylmethionine ribosyltransferase-isomerase QueA [Pseudomonadota bacterium]